jgi:multidrug resistance efflux pump
MSLQHIPPSKKLIPGLVVIAAVAWWGLGGVGTSQPSAPPAANAMSAPGRVEGGSDVLSLGTSATGTIAELLVSAGTHVRAGQHLVRVECGNIEREIEARKSDLAAAEAAYSRALHGPRPEEISVGIANVNLADARLQEAEKVLQRTLQLREGFTVTRVQMDQAQRDARMAAALLDEMHAKLALLKAGSREEDVSEARSRRDAAKGRVEEAAARLGYCSVDAPIDGIVLSTKVSRGQLVSSTVPVTLLTMVDDSTRRVRALVDEGEISRICPHQRARITAEGMPGIQMEGSVDSVGGAIADGASRQFRHVMLSVPENQQHLPIGLRVSVQFLPCGSAPGGAGK